VFIQHLPTAKYLPQQWREHIYARSYIESDPRFGSSFTERTFTIINPAQVSTSIAFIKNSYYATI